MMIEVLDEEILDENADDEKCVVKEEIGDIFEGDVQNDDNVFQEVQIENDDSQMIPLKDADDESIQYYFVDEENQVKYDAVHDGVKQNKDELKDQKHETNIDTNDNNHEVNDDNVEFDDEYHEIKDEHEFIDDGEIIYEEYIENDDTYMEQDDTQNRMEQNVFSEFGMNTEQTLSYDESEDEPKLRVYDDETKNTFTEVPVTDVIVYSGEMKETEMANIDNKVEKKRKETKEKKEKNKSSDMSTFIVKLLSYVETYL
ncbi:probable serine/threonine-protein kinase kinX [Leptidea sinapis]|uniref:probable serine/threonine-protein kinase kinX n=1 Tax=Leptidea sinapis TaxID=189913 RepID=UPI0021C319F9|nr:probable serine/threonine-protein kinase kinX [Leptidea sinapis]